MEEDYKQTADEFIKLLEVLRRLRAPGGCSWDQKQTANSLIPYLLEETYEIIEAIEDGDINYFMVKMVQGTINVVNHTT